MKEIFNKFVDLIFGSLKYAVRDTMVFPGDNLLNVLKYAVILFAISVAATLMKFPVFTNCIGAGIAVLLLAIVYLLHYQKKGGAQK